jgi:hypothetical protein
VLCYADVGTPILSSFEDTGYDPEIILDNSNPNVIKTGQWVDDTISPGFFGFDYIHDLDMSKGQKSVVYKPRTAPGMYELYTTFPGNDIFASNTLYRIYTQGSQVDINVNQKESIADWMFLGIYEFGPESAVEIRNEGADGMVVADAIRLVPINQIADRIYLGIESDEGIDELEELDYLNITNITSEAVEPQQVQDNVTNQTYAEGNTTIKENVTNMTQNITSNTTINMTGDTAFNATQNVTVNATQEKNETETNGTNVTDERYFDATIEYELELNETVSINLSEYFMETTFLEYEVDEELAVYFYFNILNVTLINHTNGSSIFIASPFGSLQITVYEEIEHIIKDEIYNGTNQTIIEIEQNLTNITIIENVSNASINKTKLSTNITQQNVSESTTILTKNYQGTAILGEPVEWEVPMFDAEKASVPVLAEEVVLVSERQGILLHKENIKIKESDLIFRELQQAVDKIERKKDNIDAKKETFDDAPVFRSLGRDKFKAAQSLSENIENIQDSVDLLEGIDINVDTNDLSKLADENVSLNINTTALPQDNLILRYTTPAPIKKENDLSPTRKQILISSDIHYTNILSFTNIQETPASQVKFYWMVDGERKDYLVAMLLY